MQDRLLAIDDQGMARIVPPLETYHGIGRFGQQVDHLALALVTPLGPQYDYVLAHSVSSLVAARRRSAGVE